MAREKTEDLQRLLELLTDPNIGEYDKMIYTRQAVVVLLNEVKKIKEK